MTRDAIPLHHITAEFELMQTTGSEASGTDAIPTSTYTKPARFTDLPVEIKEQIYVHVLRNDGHLYFIVHATTLQLIVRNYYRPRRLQYPRCDRLPEVCQTNKLERTIATLTLIRNAVLPDAKIVTRWARDMSVDQSCLFSAIKRIQLRHDPSGQSRGFQDFAKRCPGLRDLTISMGVRELCRDRRGLTWEIMNEDSLPQKRKLSCAEMVSKFDLAGIAEYTALQRLTFHICDFYLRAPFLPVNDDVVDEVAAWCWKEFAQKNGEDLLTEMYCQGRGWNYTWIEVGKGIERDSQGYFIGPK
jgi:hypothetical protein